MSIAVHSQLTKANLVGSAIDSRYQPRGMDLTTDGGFWFGAQYFHVCNSCLVFVLISFEHQKSHLRFVLADPSVLNTESGHQ